MSCYKASIRAYLCVTKKTGGRKNAPFFNHVQQPDDQVNKEYHTHG